MDPLHLPRRAVLRAGLGAAAWLASTAPTSARGAALAPARRVRKSLKFGMVQEGATVLDKFRLLKELGYDGVELDSPSGLDRDEVLRAKAATGLAIPGVVDSVHWQSTLGDPDPGVRAAGVRGLETALRDCAAFGGSTVLLVPGVVNADLAYGDVWDRSQEEVRKVLPLAMELDVKIAFENVWNGFLLSPLEAARYVDAFESDRVGWYLDVGNLVRFGWPEHWVRALGHRILKLDVKGYSRALQTEKGPWAGFQVEIGEDDCDWSKVMAALDALSPAGQGWDGWASAEVGGGGRERLADVLRRMRAVLDT